ncbi:MAG: hypothetical protein KGI54_12345 [Pseudomonadota bacterium]|nr:hypothetical protein [Pseudomonadota bacterium]
MIDNEIFDEDMLADFISPELAQESTPTNSAEIPVMPVHRGRFKKIALLLSGILAGGAAGYALLIGYQITQTQFVQVEKNLQRLQLQSKENAVQIQNLSASLGVMDKRMSSLETAQVTSTVTASLPQKAILDKSKHLPYHRFAIKNDVLRKKVLIVHKKVMPGHKLKLKTVINTIKKSPAAVTVSPVYKKVALHNKGWQTLIYGDTLLLVSPDGKQSMVRVGGNMPNGSKLLSIHSDTGTIITSKGKLSINNAVY